MTERSSEEIRRDIERTREQMDEKADALEQKLSPGEILDDLWNRVRRGNTASGLGDMFRDHPVPIALMALGLGWLAIERSTGSPGERLRRRYGPIEPGTYEPAEGRRGPYLPDDVSLRATDRESGGIGEKVGELKDKAMGAMAGVRERATGAKERASGAMEGARDKTSGAMEGARHLAGSAAGGVRDAAERAGESARDVASDVAYRARQARRGMASMLDEHPLAMAAAAFGVGLAAGVSMPSTRVEERLMGEQADAVKEQLKETGRRTADQVRDVAQDTIEAVKDESARQSDEAGIADRAKRVVDRASETARQRAREEGLTAKGRTEPPRNPGGSGQSGQ